MVVGAGRPARHVLGSRALLGLGGAIMQAVYVVYIFLTLGEVREGGIG